AEEFPEQGVEEYLVARRGTVDGLIVADVVDHGVAARGGEKGVALLRRALIEVEEEVFAHVAPRLAARLQKVFPGRPRADARERLLDRPAHRPRVLLIPIFLRHAMHGLAHFPADPHLCSPIRGERAARPTSRNEMRGFYRKNVSLRRL